MSGNLLKTVYCGEEGGHPGGGGSGSDSITLMKGREGLLLLPTLPPPPPPTPLLLLLLLIRRHHHHHFILLPLLREGEALLHLVGLIVQLDEFLETPFLLTGTFQHVADDDGVVVDDDDDGDSGGGDDDSGEKQGKRVWVRVGCADVRVPTIRCPHQTLATTRGGIML